MSQAFAVVALMILQMVPHSFRIQVSTNQLTETSRLSLQTKNHYFGSKKSVCMATVDFHLDTCAGHLRKIPLEPFTKSLLWAKKIDPPALIPDPGCRLSQESARI